MTITIPQRVTIPDAHRDPVFVGHGSMWDTPFTVELAPGKRVWHDVVSCGVTRTTHYFSRDIVACHRRTSQLYARWITRVTDTHNSVHGTLESHAKRSLTVNDIRCSCPVWDSSTPCTVCDGKQCAACAGTGLARWACHGDVLLRVANPGVVFPWAEATPWSAPWTAS